ncbi:kelch-like protein 40b [Physella acuta]|uniref:kelch-like protein 40b n=1 Tax=Physella acuta TaxID=109671 RepID=UPI0027DB8954|nr:kelch-like protein 40b [Physella acuta]
MFHSNRISVADYHKDDDLHIAEEVCRCFDKNKENYTDFTVNVGDTKFNCHKFVLSSCSGFFEALMRTDMREKSESSCTIEGISPEIFGLILDCIYKGKDVLDMENMLDMWHASNQLQIKFLVSLCENFVKKSVNLQNYWEIFTDAKLLDSINVTTRVKQFMVKNFEKIVESNDFMQLSFDDFKFILMHSWSISADIIVESVLKWTNVDDFYLLHEPKYFIKAPNTESNNCHLKSLCRKGNISKSDQFMEASYLLSRLLVYVPLEGASDECLNKLMNNKFVLANDYSITRVNRIVASRFTLEKIKTEQNACKRREIEFGFATSKL